MCAQSLLRLPEPAKAQTIVDCARSGMTSQQITVAIRGHNDPHEQHMVERVLQDVDRFDTDVDDVAVARAYGGDRPVWDALTHYERRACIDLVMDRALARKTHKCWPGLPPTELGRGLGWLGLWACEVGEQPERMARILHKRRLRATAGLA